MDKIIARISTKIEEIGEYEFSTSDDSITVKQKNEQGFSVTLRAYQNQEFIVNYGHYWHGHFNILEDAEECFLSGVTGNTRLKCIYHWRYLTKAAVEEKCGENWQQVEQVGSCLGFLVSWLPKRIIVYLNSSG